MKYTIRAILALKVGFLLFFAGCHIVEVNMVQRNIMDKGDATRDSYSKVGDSRLDDEKSELIVPIK